MEVTVNGTRHQVDAEDDMPLLWLVREQLGLTGTKFGCGIAVCGACTLHGDGNAVRSCAFPAALASGKSITTIEGLSRDRSHPLQRAWIVEQVPQCGYCQSGMLMAAAALLRQVPQPTPQQIDAAIANLCRCGTYQRVRRAIERASCQLPTNKKTS
ncbi:(2Fe-2S)-binding protein [Massilia sp. PWRC2]|uniref:(2Fe-2S)-binding protein n=1 Tax=Massilia sp. PWRC2 TaxID=2804626 RepID=UPI003CE7D033